MLGKGKLSEDIQLLFDCDNTLSHVEQAACTIAYRIALEEYERVGKSLESIISLEEWLQQLPGKTIRDFLVSLEERGGVVFPHSQLDLIAADEDRRVCEHFSQGGVLPSPGLIETLTELQDSVHMGVVSNSSLPRVFATLEGAGLIRFFDSEFIFSARDCEETKPSPLVYLKALEARNSRFNISIEDSESGVVSAVKAGLPVVIYCGAYEDPSSQAEKLGTIAAGLNGLYEVILEFRPDDFKTSILSLCNKVSGQ